MRVKSELWIKAYLRHCQGEGASAVVARRGDRDAGAIYICINRLDGTLILYGPAPAGLEGGETERHWVRCVAADAISDNEAAAYLTRQMKFDSDIWIVDVEDKAGRHFLGDAVTEE